MTAPANIALAKTRYAVGMLGPEQDVDAAVAELMSRGISADGLEIVAAGNEPGRSPTISAILAAYRTDGACCTPANLKPPRGHRLGLADDWDTARLAITRGACRLDEHVRSGGSVVIVHLDGDVDESRICRALLSLARCGVQTHELRTQ